MLRMFNTYRKSKTEYWSLIFYPQKKNDFDRIERIQKNFTSKISGLEEINYDNRLKKLGLYSLERRRERFLIINVWQHLEGIKENALKQKHGEREK